ncbi:MAG: phosphatidate cytidylyltransferase [Deltaproteobacteria bacterium]|nr:phosphatidate cytidylyltransferase [Deltaproteobacteria bacterium]
MDKSKETSTRVMTGVVGGAILLALFLIGGHLGVSFASAILGGLMCWELSNVFYGMSDRKEKLTALVGLSWLTIFVNMLIPKSMLECLVVSFMGMFTYYLAVADRHSSELRRHFDELVFTVFALVYVVTFVAFLPLIRDGANGIRWLLLFLFIVWAGDTGAYFVGRKWGKNKLYPLISPGKSLEGSGGGLAASLLVTIVFKLVAFGSLSWLGAVITAVMVGVISQIGDLCESFFKRAYKIKDSSKILPGHGGILDRFDGVLFSLPVMYFCVKLFS